MSHAKRPTVSIVIPTFNRAHCLTEALDSIFAQGIDDVQPIVIDDGSTDDTERVMVKYGRRVHYVKQPHRGAAAARNAGIARATGRFVSFLDSDDVWMPGKTKIELAVFDQHPDVDAVISDSERWRDHALVCSSWLADRGVVVTGDSPTPMLVTHLEKGKTFATCSLTIKRAALARLGAPLFDTTLETHEDLDFAIRMQRCCSIMIVPKTLAQVRRFNDGSRVGRPLPGTEYPRRSSASWPTAATGSSTARSRRTGGPMRRCRICARADAKPRRISATICPAGRSPAWRRSSPANSVTGSSPAPRPS